MTDEGRKEQKNLRLGTKEVQEEQTEQEMGSLELTENTWRAAEESSRSNNSEGENQANIPEALSQAPHNA